VNEDIQLKHLTADQLDKLAPLWKALHRHHVGVAGHLEPIGAPLSPEASWRNRRAKYVAWLASPDAFALIAEVDGEPVGYAMARVKGQAPGSWERGAKTGVLESLSVRADQRGGGIGTRLFEAVRSEFVKRDAAQLELAVIASNEDAIRFYARQGLVPYVTTLVGRS
jgi:GNAT superfamily N-acetyltransferase